MNNGEVGLPGQSDIIIRKERIVIGKDWAIFEIHGQRKVEISWGARWKGVVAANLIRIVRVLEESNGASDRRWDRIISWANCLDNALGQVVIALYN